MIRNSRVVVDPAKYKAIHGHSPTRASIDKLVNDALAGAGSVQPIPSAPASTAPRKAAGRRRR
jgi:hypothetical protein